MIAAMQAKSALLLYKIAKTRMHAHNGLAIAFPASASSTVC